MTGSAGATAPESTRPPRRTRGFGSLVLAFLLGGLVTAATAVVLVTFDVLDPADAPAAPAPSSSPDTARDGTRERATGDVPPACVEAAEYNQTFTEALDEIAVGARDQDARRLQEALDAVQDAQPGSEAASRECRELAGAEGTDGSGDDEPAGAEDDGTAGSEASPDPDRSSSAPEPTPEPTSTPAP